MARRIWIMGSASVLAVLVLLVTLFAGPKAPRDRDSAILPIQQGVPRMTRTATIDDPFELVERADHVDMHWRRSNGQPVRIVADHAVPRGADEVQLTRLVAEVVQRPGRLLRVSADTGQVIAPDGRLSRGVLQGNVVISSVDIGADGREHVGMRVELEDAHFNSDVGELSSDKSVVVTSDRFVFRGRGLTLAFNELHERLEGLIIDQGVFLRFVVEDEAEDADAGSVGEDAKPQVAGEDEGDYYEAKFADDVRIQSDQVDLAGELLSAFFRVDADDDGDDEHRDDKDADRDGATLLQMVEGAKRPADVAQLTWSGPLTVAPRTGPPAVWEHRDDVLLRISGAPVRIKTIDGEQVEAAETEYLFSRQQATLIGSDRHPLRIDAPQLGRLTVPKVLITQKYGTGQLLGPGQLETRGRSTRLLDDADGDGERLVLGSQMPSNLDITWYERVDLTFYMADPDVPPGDGERRLRALRTASFHGHARAVSSKFHVTADQLGIGLDPPSGAKQTAHTIDAIGNVVVKSFGDEAHEPLSVKADQINVELTAAADGDSRPKAMSAQGHVHLVRHDSKLSTDRLDVAVAVDGSGTPDATNIEAVGHTRIEFADEHDQIFTVRADRALADITEARYELFGTKQEPVQIVRGEITLSGGYIVLDQVNEVMQVVGPGVWTIDQGGDRGKVMTVAWSDSMRFDERTDEVHFKGNVVTNSRSGLDTTKLTCRQMTLWLGRAVPPDDLPSARDADALGDLRASGRTVERLTATGDVKFLATGYADKIGGPYDTQLLIRGPEMVFENAMRDGVKVEQLQFNGAGQMQLVDRRTEPKSTKNRVGQSGVVKGARGAVVNLTGRGATTFTWSRKMLLDVVNNDMRLYDDVWMVHGQLDDDETIELECDRFVADLAQTGGLATWTSGESPDMQIVAITARRDVVVTQAAKQIKTHELKYTKHDEFITLTPAEGGRTIVIVDGTSRSFEDPLRWNRVTDQVTGGRPGVVRESVSPGSK